MNKNQVSRTSANKEEIQQNKIESFFLSVYPANHMISHGLDHHRRVWNYSRELSELMLPGADLTLRLNENLRIACFFHDIGMSEDHGISHGKISRVKCTEFLREEKLDPGDFKMALDAVEYHDDKEYKSGHGDNIILEILSLADDMDAYGFTGIYRYADIYLRRNTPILSLSESVRRNASNRIRNLMNNKKVHNSYKKVHLDRYHVLVKFYEKLNEELPSYTPGKKTPGGYSGVIEIISNSIKNKNEQDFSNILLQYSNNPVINWYRTGYESEISESIS